MILSPVSPRAKAATVISN